MNSRGGGGKDDTAYDIFIIGGGINGMGIARDAAGRGLKVGLVERGDFGAQTSSASTKLVHGGLRYLEHYEFRLVRESLKEREALLAAAPHIIWPLRFVLPHHKALRPAWLLRLGLFLYDHLGGPISLPKSEKVNLTDPRLGEALKPDFSMGFAYSDCWVEDSRLVVLNAVDAQARGADLFSYTECNGISRKDDVWEIRAKTATGEECSFRSQILVNAAGPWVDEIAAKINPRRNRSRTRLVKGSHIVFNRLYQGDHAFIFQNADGRIVFTIPYEGRFTLVGTTDVSVDASDISAEPTPEEEDYLCALINGYFQKPVTRNDIVWRFSGVRPLFDDDADTASKVTRDYKLLLDCDGPPVLSIYGGKITTYRQLAEHAIAKLQPFLKSPGPAWTKKAPLPGGDFGGQSFENLVMSVHARFDFLPQSLVRRLVRA